MQWKRIYKGANDKGGEMKLKWYSEYFEKEVGISSEDQKWIWENLHVKESNNEVKKNASVKGSVNGTYKNDTNLKLTISKSDALSSLGKCDYKTAPKKTAAYLEIIFSKYPSKEGHWLYIAQNYTPRTIKWVLKIVFKYQKRGEIYKTPAALFTYLIKRRKKRKRVYEYQ